MSNGLLRRNTNFIEGLVAMVAKHALGFEQNVHSIYP